MQSYYDILHVSEEASVSDIEEAARRRFAEINPGNLPLSELAGPNQSLLRIVELSRKTLTDPVKRQNYDLEIKGRGKLQVVSANAAVEQVSVSPPVSVARLGGAVTCVRCNDTYAVSAIYCPGCGTPNSQMSLAQSIEPRTASVIVEAPVASRGVGDGFWKMRDRLAGALGWVTARGVVINAESPYQVDSEFILWRFLLRSVVIGFVLWVVWRWILANTGFLIVLAIVLAVLLYFAAGVVTAIVRPLVSLVTALPILEKEKQVTVRDVRLRDLLGNEVLVRFRGELRSGQAQPGDEIQVTGSSRGGTVMARWGYNFRTRTRIRVRYR